MSGLEFSIKGLDEQQHRLRDDRRGRVGVAVAVVASLFALAGRGPVAPALVAALAANPQRLDFGVQQVGTPSPTRTVTLTNVGTKDFIADYTALVGQPFAVSACHTHAYGNDADGSTCTLTVAFRPGSPGADEARVAVFEVDPTGARVGVALVTIDLTGRGEPARPDVTPPQTPPQTPQEPPRPPPPPASIEVVPTELDFSAPRPRQQEVVVRNAGGAAASVSGATIVGRSAGSFRADAGNCTAQPLGAGRQCTITVTRGLFAAASLTAELQIRHAAAGTPARVQLTRTPAPAATVRADPASLVFGTVAVGSRASERATITNVGSVAANSPISGFLFQDSDSFSIGQNDCRGTLAPQAQCAVEVVFAPKKAGSLQSSLLIAGTAIPVSGLGEATQRPLPPVVRQPAPGAPPNNGPIIN